MGISLTHSSKIPLKVSLSRLSSTAAYPFSKKIISNHGDPFNARFGGGPLKIPHSSCDALNNLAFCRNAIEWTSTIFPLCPSHVGEMLFAYSLRECWLSLTPLEAPASNAIVRYCPVSYDGADNVEVR